MNLSFTESFNCEKCKREKKTSVERMARLNWLKSVGEPVQCSKCSRDKYNAENEIQRMELMERW